jgi:hypothetical protein
MDILYYSNYCKHSQKVVQALTKGGITDKISFICIDKRSKDPKTNQQYIILENGSKVIMPPNLHSVPALLLVNQKYQFLWGDEIVKHFHPQMLSKREAANPVYGEPIGYPLGGLSTGKSNIVSENYTLYSMTAEELSAKGNGDRRALHNYVSAADDILTIQTPPDNYRPDKVSTSVTIDGLQQQRMDEISKR